MTRRASHDGRTTMNDHRTLHIEMTRLIATTFAWSMGVGITAGLTFVGIAAIFAW
jgi:hypothetical protein